MDRSAKLIAGAEVPEAVAGPSAGALGWIGSMPDFGNLNPTGSGLIGPVRIGLDAGSLLIEGNCTHEYAAAMQWIGVGSLGLGLAIGFGLSGFIPPGPPIGLDIARLAVMVTCLFAPMAVSIQLVKAHAVAHAPIARVSYPLATVGFAAGDSEWDPAREAPPQYALASSLARWLLRHFGSARNLELTVPAADGSRRSLRIRMDSASSAQALATELLRRRAIARSGRQQAPQPDSAPREVG